MTETATTTDSTDQRLSLVLISLFKGVLYRDADVRLWESLLALEARVRDYIEVLGLMLVLDEAEGYAYLRQRPEEDDATPLPRLVRRRQLSYPVSLLLALIRKKLAEHDAGGGDPRLILSREQIVDLLRVFLPETANEARLMDRIDSHINKVVDLGFLRRLRGTDDRFEVRRIITSFIDAEWLADLDRRLAEYAAHVDESSGEE
ncbi:MAG: DUF4194 domain-containing protein [Guyparkeria sp.]